LGCPHHTHGHAYKATGYPEVSMLTGSLAATEIVFQILGTITANMECRLYDEVFENMVAPFADVGMSASYTWPCVQSDGLSRSQHADRQPRGD